MSWVGSGVVFLACCACYYNSLQCGFVFDDVSAIKDNKDLRPHSPLTNLFVNDFWGTPMQKEQSHKSYRPLCVLTFRWNYLVHGLEPMGYHLVNMLLHGVVTVMYLRMCSMFLPELSSFLAALMFAVHPVHTEAVTGVVGRAEMMSSVFFLAALMAYSRCTGYRKHTVWPWLALCMLFVVIAMLCKEQGITIIGVCAVYEIFLAQRLRIWDLVQVLQTSVSGKASIPSWFQLVCYRLGVLLAFSVALLLARVHIMGAQLPVFTRFDNPASVAEFPTRHLTFNYLVAVNLWLLMFPWELCCDWTMGTVPLVTSPFDPRNLITLATYVSLGTLAYQALLHTDRHHRTVLLMSLSLMAFPFLPASNLFFPVGFVVAERILYMPSMGYSMLIAYGWTLIYRYRRWRKAWLVALLFLLLVHSIRTVFRNWDWRSEYSIFMAGLKVNQKNAKLFNNVGHALEGQAKYEEALRYFQKAVRVQEDDIGAHINVGRTYNHLKLYEEAEEAYIKAKSLLPKAKPGESYQARIAPSHLKVFLNLANLIARNQTRLEEADLLYRQAIAMRSDYTQAYINRGDVLLKMNRTKEAQEVYERALFYDSNNPDIYYNLGVVYLEQGKAPQALAYLDKALELDPDHTQALMNSAILIQELGNSELRATAVKRLRKLLVKDQTNERVFFNLGMLAMDDGDASSAETWFRKAVAIKEDFRSALFNLALLLSDIGRPLEAVPFLHQLMKYFPGHTKGLILLGDININTLRDLHAAEKCYEQILSLEPDNVQGLHNLCVVYVERGELARAETCFSRAHHLAPHEDYILKHLRIVRSRLRKQQGAEETTEDSDAHKQPAS